MKKCFGKYMQGVIRKGLPDDEDKFRECLECEDGSLCQGTYVVNTSDYIAPSMRRKYIEMGILKEGDPRALAPARDSDQSHTRRSS